MSHKSSRKIRTRTGRSLNLVLWFSFSIFALAIILVYAVVQNFLVQKQYRELAVDRLLEAGGNMLESIETNEDVSSLPRVLYGIANNYGIQLRILDTTGESVYAEYSDDHLSYPEITAMLEKSLYGNPYCISRDGYEISYGTSATIENRTCYLYLTMPAGALTESMEGFRWISLITGLFSVVLAFIASGFVAMLITKPVTEVTERAKELARGNYSLNFKKDYFCSEITELSDALECARTEISKAEAIQKELIANVSHDFKTPLTMIKAYASMIREISGEDKEKRDAHAQIIIDESDRLATLVGDLLDLSKLRAGFSAEGKTIFNLSDEVYRIASRFDYLKETDGYTIEIQVEDDIYVHAERERIEQVLYNLIGNAINYTGKDKRIRVKLLRKDGMSRFEVIDTGKGIPADEVDTIWDRYYRSNKTHKRPVQGTGLGLSIVKGILVAHEFPYGVISQVGKGSCFWVEFPSPEKDAAEEFLVKTAEKKKRKRRKET